jgi:hypothetical protein
LQKEYVLKEQIKMATPPIIISDDGSPPPFEGIQALRVGRKAEDMDELTSANGGHPIKNSTGIKKVMITQPRSAGNSFDEVDSLEVRGNLGTSITVEVVEMPPNVVVTTSDDLDQESATGFGHRYAAKDPTIVEVLINGTSIGYDPALGRGHVAIEVS